MEPTIHPGELLDFDPSAYDDAEPEVGDVIALLAPKGYELGRCDAPRPLTAPCAEPSPELSDDGLLKRIVGLPGDRIAISPDGTVIRNGHRTLAPYLLRCSPRDHCALPDAIVVASGHYFVLGDNRPVSGDSRHWGPVPFAAIEGKVTPLRGPDS